MQWTEAEAYEDLSPSLAQRVFRRLETAIRRGDMRPGDRVYDHALARQYGVSRSPVREALQRLEYLGLIMVIPRRGTYVAALLSPEEAADLLEIREALEGVAARKAARRLPDVQIENMAREMEALRGRVKSAGFGYALDFHEWILEASGSAKLKSILRGIQGQVRLIRFRLPVTAARAAASLREHQAIFEAIRARDPEGAEACMRAHIQVGRENMLRHWGAQAMSEYTTVTRRAASGQRGTTRSEDLRGGMHLAARERLPQKVGPGRRRRAAKAHSAIHSGRKS
jgi:DNA-binding GntR family transcriptional regulator